MIETNIPCRNKESFINSQTIFIDQMLFNIRCESLEMLNKLINAPELINIDINWDYTIAKAMLNIAIKNVNNTWPTDCHFNRTCKQYEQIINEERKNE